MTEHKNKQGTVIALFLKPVHFWNEENRMDVFVDIKAVVHAFFFVAGICNL